MEALWKRKRRSEGFEGPGRGSRGDAQSPRDTPGHGPYGLLVRVGVDHPAVTTMEVAAEPDVFSELTGSDSLNLSGRSRAGFTLTWRLVARSRRSGRAGSTC